ncbi:MAG: 16S rRNA (guanine(966)-N(2))-methyltransferase RsmD [Rhodobacteraceae bacterium]|nr:16S rRNA (guanine(966)-N(2))-methyltransferase RsmD [Paracoccaceae bacterium]
MRIIGGAWRGRRLADVGAGDAAAHLRPTLDRVRETMFNLLLNGHHADPVTGARVLDLFAGTGALGLEALSRGAAHATFVDNGAAARALLRKNIALCRAQGAARVVPRDAARLGGHRGTPFDLVFLDPPYGQGLGAVALAAGLAGGWIRAGALIIWEGAIPPATPSALCMLDQRPCGGSVISILEAAD